MKELRYQLHSIFDKNFSIVRGWTFAKFFFWSQKKKMSSVGVLTKKNLSVLWEKKNLSVLWEKKNLSVRRKIFKVWRGEKCKCRISGVRKKKWKLKEKFRKKKSKCFWVEIKVKVLLNSCSLVGLYVNLQVKVMEKFEIKKNVRVMDVPLVGRHVVNKPKIA